MGGFLGLICISAVLTILVGIVGYILYGKPAT
jgi:hypothetical protein